MSRLLTMKFGGTSVGSVDALQRAAVLVVEQSHQWDRMVIVVSAMSGITDTLLKSAKSAIEADEHIYGPLIKEIQNRHHQTIDELLQSDIERTAIKMVVDKYISELTAFCHSIHILGEVTPRGLDAISSFGERMNARLFAALLRQKGLRTQAVDATDLILTDNTFQNASPLWEETRAQMPRILNPMLEDGIVPVVTGFIGATQDGIITTLGRGGSDYTSAIIGDCLDADEVWTWTDVDGVMTADPRIVPEAHIIPELSYDEVSEMAYAGAKVLHPKTIRPIITRGIPLWVKNTFNPDCPGTRIDSKMKTAPGKISAVTMIASLSLITVEGRGMLGVPGIAGRTFLAAARKGASILMISQSSSEQAICFVIPMQSTTQVLQSIRDEMALEILRRDIDRVWSQDDVAIVSIIGAGMRSTPGVSALIFAALRQENINVIAIAQGSSDLSMSLVVAAKEAQDAIRAIHKEVIENGGEG